MRKWKSTVECWGQESAEDCELCAEETSFALEKEERKEELLRSSKDLHHTDASTTQHQELQLKP